jgi:hypothetical protein
MGASYTDILERWCKERGKRSQVKGFPMDRDSGLGARTRLKTRSLYKTCWLCDLVLLISCIESLALDSSVEKLFLQERRGNPHANSCSNQSNSSIHAFVEA